MFALLSSLIACTGEPLPCSEQAGLQRDRCFADELATLGAEQADQVSAKASAIQDGIVRSAALDLWMKEHAQSIPREQAMQLCELLEGPTRSACVKRVNAAHLNR